MILENSKDKYHALVSIDGEYFWIITTAASKDAARRNANAVAAVRFANTDSVRLGSHLISKNNKMETFIDNEIDPEKWKRAKPLRTNEKEQRPSLASTSDAGELAKRAQRFMEKHYGNDPSGVLSANFDMEKLIKIAKQAGFTDAEIKNHEFQTVVNAFVYSRLK